MELRAAIEEIRRAGKAAGDAADDAGQVRLDEVLREVGTALPGSRTALGVAGVSAAWRERLDGWTADTRAYGTRLTAAAELYARNDARAAEDISQAWWVLPSPSWPVD